MSSSAIMTETVIRCEGVGKAFQLYMHRNDQLKQTLFGHWKNFYKEHWVLRDVTFAVSKGECVGIIGRNGAGKTTLLQILCGITTQTHGTTTIEGRLAPILALGAGFDLELTGRENALIGRRDPRAEEGAHRRAHGFDRRLRRHRRLLPPAAEDVFVRHAVAPGLRDLRPCRCRTS